MVKIVTPNFAELISNPNYLVGKAWHMDVDNDSQGVDAQKWLFRMGFTWPHGETEIEPKRANLQSIWWDNIEHKTFTGADSEESLWDVSASVRICEGEGINELYVFEFNDIIENTPDTHDIFNQLYESENLVPFRDEDPIEIKYPQVGDFLYCHTDLVMEHSDIVEATRGRSYEVVAVDYGDIMIIDNSGDHHSFDKRGEWNYTRWFTLIPKEHMKDVLDTDFFDNLTEEVKNPPTVGHRVYMIMHDSGKYVMSKNLTYGVHWVNIDDYGRGEYEDYNLITFKTEGKAKEMLRLVNQTFGERKNISGYKLNADYIDRYNPHEWQVVEYLLGLMPQENLFENFKRDYDYTNIQFTLIQNGKPNGTTYTIGGRCTPDWVSQTDPEGWIVSWENHMPDPYSFVQRPRYMKACIQTDTIVRNFNDGTYVPINLASSDEVSGLFDELL